MPVTDVAASLAGAVESLLGGALPVRIRAWDGSAAGPSDAPTVVVRSPLALRRLLWAPGELSLARAYVAGELDVEGDLADGLRRALRAAHAAAHARVDAPAHTAAATRRREGRPRAGDYAGLLRLGGRLGVLGPPPRPPAAEARLHGRLHSRHRDRAAIAHHYDLSNAFYRLILDPDHLAYSCGYWTSDDPAYGLADAQRDKLEMVCRKLGLQPGGRLLDVGCGWGALSLYAAREHGVRVTGVTLSREQLALARRRAQELGVDGQVDVRLQDYRDLDDGPYDAVASLEMGEHVGAGNYPAFAATLHRLVRPRGRVLVQQMSRRGGAPGGGAFIERYIAPDMHMRPLGETAALLEDAGLEVRDVEALREHYVRTIRAWHAALEERWDDAVALVGEEMARVWRLYLVGSALAFEEQRMGVDQIVAVRPDGTGASGMPLTREPPARPVAG